MRPYPRPNFTPAGPAPDWDVTTPPLTQIRQMDGETFFTMAAEVLVYNPPYPADAALVAQMAEIGLVPGQPFDWDALSPDQQQALDRAVQAG